MKIQLRPAGHARHPRWKLTITWILLTVGLLVSSTSLLPGCVQAQSIIPIHTIHGSGNISPLVGQTITTIGIVTGFRTGSSGGLFLQTLDTAVDADPNTSEGIF